MGVFHFDSRWLGNQGFELSSSSIVELRGRRIGLGAFVIIECVTTGRFLLGRKSLREGFVYSEKLTFPGGMVRTSTTSQGTFQDWLTKSLAKRHSAEMGIDIAHLESVAPQDHIPPYIGSYEAKGNTVTTLVLPFYASVRTEISPTTSDPSVYNVAWRELEDVWNEISPSNGLALANYLWNRLDTSQQTLVQELLEPSHKLLLEGAISNRFQPPVVPWRTND